MKKLILLAMVLGLVVSGCATAQMWNHFSIKEGSTPKQFEQDKRDCLAQCYLDFRAEKYFRECMEFRGYIWEETK